MADDFIKLSYPLSGEIVSTEFDTDEVESIELIPQSQDDMQRLQNNLPIIYQKPDSKQITLNLHSQNISDVEALVSVTDIITLKVYFKTTLLHSYAVKIDRESCKTFGYFGGVPYDKKFQLIFYETESGYVALESQFNGIVC
jgi:hypothetical protein